MIFKKNFLRERERPMLRRMGKMWRGVEKKWK